MEMAFPKPPKNVKVFLYNLPRYEPPSSQKARGIAKLLEKSKTLALPSMNFICLSKGARLPRENPGKFWQAIANSFSYISDSQAFVRACPSRPRHGVLESFPIAAEGKFLSREGLKKAFALLKKITAEDPEGEVIIQPFLESDYSAVLGPRGIVFGEGHDGVTSGRGKTFSLPDPSLYVQAYSLLFDGESERPSVQFELVQSKQSVTFWTQIREAESAEVVSQGIQGFVPNGEIVSLKGLEPLIIREAEQLADLEKLPPGARVVVWHPEGSALSHAAAWCVQQRLPYFCCAPRLRGFALFSPKEGALFFPTRKQAEEAREKLPQAPQQGPEDFSVSFWRGVDDSQFLSEEFWENVVPSQRTALFGFPHYFFSSTILSEEFAYFSGLAVGVALLAGAASCIGEFRYLFKYQKPASAFGGLRSWYENQFGVAQPDRTCIYQQALRWGISPELPEALEALALGYTSRAWPERTGMGGISWGVFAHQVASLAQGVKERDFAKTNLAFQVVLNAVHNHGWALNKLFDKLTLDHLATRDDRKVFWKISFLFGMAWLQFNISKLLSGPEVLFQESWKEWLEKVLKAKTEALVSGELLSLGDPNRLTEFSAKKLALFDLRKDWGLTSPFEEFYFSFAEKGRFPDTRWVGADTKIVMPWNKFVKEIKERAEPLLCLSVE